MFARGLPGDVNAEVSTDGTGLRLIGVGSTDQLWTKGKLDQIIQYFFFLVEREESVRTWRPPAMTLCPSQTMATIGPTNTKRQIHLHFKIE